MKTINLILAVLIVFNLFSQEDKNWRLYPGKNLKATNTSFAYRDTNAIKQLNFNNVAGSVNIYQTSEIDTLSSHIAMAPYVLGYTIQLEVSQQTSKIRDARYKLLKIEPNAPMEEKYLAPNTYLYGGVFYSRTDAYEFKNEIKNHFPNAIVIAKKMTLPPLATE